MGVEVKLQVPVAAPVEAVILSSSMGTRRLTFRPDSNGAKRGTVVFERYASRNAAERGNAPLDAVKTSVFPADLRALANGLLSLADSIEGK